MNTASNPGIHGFGVGLGVGLGVGVEVGGIVGVGVGIGVGVGVETTVSLDVTFSVVVGVEVGVVVVYDGPLPLPVVGVVCVSSSSIVLVSPPTFTSNSQAGIELVS